MTRDISGSQHSAAHSPQPTAPRGGGRIRHFCFQYFRRLLRPRPLINGKLEKQRGRSSCSSSTEMEANRPLAASSRRRRAPQEFYQPAEPGASAAEIVAAARRSLRVPATQRPCTPADPRRALFGKSRTTSRPPSVYRCAQEIGTTRQLQSKPLSLSISISPPLSL